MRRSPETSMFKNIKWISTLRLVVLHGWILQQAQYIVHSCTNSCTTKYKEEMNSLVKMDRKCQVRQRGRSNLFSKHITLRKIFCLGYKVAGTKVWLVMSNWSTIVLLGSLVSTYSQPGIPPLRYISSSSVRVLAFLPLAAMTSPPASRAPHRPNVPAEDVYRG